MTYITAEKTFLEHSKEVQNQIRFSCGFENVVQSLRLYTSEEAFISIKEKEYFKLCEDSDDYYESGKAYGILALEELEKWKLTTVEI